MRMAYRNLALSYIEDEFSDLCAITLKYIVSYSHIEFDETFNIDSGHFSIVDGIKR